MDAWELLRLSLHVTAATVWLGGQVVLAALVPVLRSAAPEQVPVAARAFARIAWPAFAVLVLTGAWNAWAIRHELHGSAAVVFAFKLSAVVLSGTLAAAHQVAGSPQARAWTGAGTALSALAALVLGIQLTL
jgi:putative copper export protein